MASVGLRDQYRLKGVSNFGIWKSRILLILEENGLMEFMTSVKVIPADVAQLLTYKKEDDKTKRIILDGVKDHIMPHTVEEDMGKKMWEEVCKLYQDSSVNMKLILRRNFDAQRKTKVKLLCLTLPG